MYNPGKYGNERADEVMPYVENWLNKNAKKDNWFLHVNMWDPHTRYRTPLDYGNPFEKVPAPNWLNDKIIKQQYNSYGPNSAQDLCNWRSYTKEDSLRAPAEIKSMKDFKKWIDGYDVGIHYADYHVGKIIGILKEQGIWDDVVIIMSSDHGENHGELNIYGDHHTADHITSRVPFIIRWPGILKKGVNKELYYQNDLAASILEFADIKVPDVWDGRSFAKSIRNKNNEGRDYLVVSQCAWSCQRSVRFGDYLLIRTFHTGLKDFPEIMLFNVKKDPHETKNLAKENPSIVNKGLVLLEQWTREMMNTSLDGVDPLWQVMNEGGPYHTRCIVGWNDSYCDRLRKTGRGKYVEIIEKYKGLPHKRQ
jgi:arylsulfatase A-like enzyme